MLLTVKVDRSVPNARNICRLETVEHMLWTCVLLSGWPGGQIQGVHDDSTISDAWQHLS